MADTEASQTWVSTGRGGAGNFPYTPRALAKRPVHVNLSNPQGREVDYRRQSVARSGRGGVGFWEPKPDDSSKQQESQDFERDQEIIKERLAKRQSLTTGENFVFKSGRGGAGNIGSPAEQRLPTTAAEGDALERVHSYGRGGSNYRFGDAIPMVDMNKIENEERVEAKARLTTAPTNGESGFTTFTSYASAFFNALTPAENRIENMTPVSSPTTPSSASKRTSVAAGGRGGAGNFSYATYKSAASTSTSTTAAPVVLAPASPSRAYVRGEPEYAGYAASHGRDYDPEMPVASGSSSSGASGSTSRWA